MPHFVGCAAVEHVADEAMAVRRHRDQIGIGTLRELDDLRRGIAHRENRIGFETFRAQFILELAQVIAIVRSSLRFPGA